MRQVPKCDKCERNIGAKRLSRIHLSHSLLQRCSLKHREGLTERSL